MKTWVKKFCAVYCSSNHGIQRIELFESEDAFVKQNPYKIIPLSDCIKVSPAPQKQQPNVFEVRTKSNAHQFSAETFQDMTDWLTSFQSVAFGKLSKLHPPVAKDEKQEENMLYSSMDEPEIFPVKALATDATLRNNLIGDYKLVITSVNLSVAEECSQGRMGRIVLTWPYRHIRRYGCTTENFSFEAGRKCTSGEGLFTFSTNDGMIIFQSVDSHVLALKSSQTESDIPSSPSLNADKDNFFSSKDSLLNKRDSIHSSVGHFGAVLGNDNDPSFMINKSSTFKSIAPVPKPPRKTKSSKSAYSFSTQNVSNAKDDSYDDPQISSSVYEELFKANSQKSYHKAENSSGVSTFNNSEQASKTNETALSYNVEKLRLHVMPKHQELSTFSACDYENCEPLLFKTKSVPKSDNIYGKLTNVRQSMPSKDSANIYGSILPKRNSVAESATSPVYSNVPFHKNSCDSINFSSDYKRDPDHFIKNDAEYAQIFKKSDDNL